MYNAKGEIAGRTCEVPPPEGYGPCSRELGHDGPCCMDFADSIRIASGTLTLESGTVLNLPSGLFFIRQSRKD